MEPTPPSPDGSSWFVPFEPELPVIDSTAVRGAAATADTQSRLSAPSISRAAARLSPEIVSFYSDRCDEATRLTSTVKGRLEDLRMRELLERFLPSPPAQVADIGGGTGVHASWLQRRGYTVELLDPIERHVDQAITSGVPALVGDARHLPWRSETFDVALLAGPLYHLPQAPDRRLALRESVRVLRPGGMLVAIAINRAANLIGATIANTLLARMPVVSEILERGHSPGNDRLPDGYYHTLTQLRSELAGVGLTSIVVRGLTRPGSWLGVLINAHYGESELPATVAEPDPLQTALASARLADRSPELAVASSVLFAVAKKPT